MNRVDSSAATVAMVAQPAMARWRLVLSVFKLRIGTLIMLTAIAGLAVVPGGGATPWQSLVLALSVLVASASAGAGERALGEKDEPDAPAGGTVKSRGLTVQGKGPGW